MTAERKPCPDYYLMAGGREFADYSRDCIAPMCERNGMTPWDIHCLISACEHLFRMGAKEGEEQSDWEAFTYWSRQVDKSHFLVQRSIIDGVIKERYRVGR